MKPLISIIIPCYNEASMLRDFYKALRRATDPLDGYRFEFIFVDDGSVDKTVPMLEKLADFDYRVTYLQFSRNFGKEIATTAGLRHARGHAALMLDADLQHPPERIKDFLEAWVDGAEVVVGVRENAASDKLSQKIAAALYYRIMNLISDTPIIRNATDFRLLDRSVINAFNQLDERNRITRGLIDWLGFSRTLIPFISPARENGTASYSTLKRIKLAISSVISHSLFPLRFAGYLGIAIMITSGLLGLFMFTNNYILNDPWGLNFSGPAQLAVINLFLIGIVLSCLGLIALYIGNINEEVTNRPLFIVKKTNNQTNAHTQQKKKTVAVSGHFNPLHQGHVEFLKTAKSLGDKLVVIVNNDRQVALKGTVPFMNETERAAIIQSVRYVDEVLIAVDTDSTVQESLRIIKPDIFANGGDGNKYSQPEGPVCEELGIEIINNICAVKGSSSALLRNAYEYQKKLHENPLV